MSSRLHLTVETIKKQFRNGELSRDQKTLNRLKNDPRKGVRKICDQILEKIHQDEMEQVRINRLLEYEKRLWASGVQMIAGIDEVGVGPLAGPVVAAAVVFPPACQPIPVEDSKLLPESKRLRLLNEIERSALSIGIGTVNPAEIDRINIFQATLLSMRRAVEQLEAVPQHLLVDARHIPGIECPQTAIIQGDRHCFSIAAASIVAKTHRDQLMAEYDSQFPQYGFRSHKGYPTARHREAIQRFGPCSIHRRSFRLLEQEMNLQPSLFSLE